MSGLARRLMAAGGAAEKLYVDDVFSTYLYTGNGSTQTINNGIDLAGKGGLVWTKNRTGANSHYLFGSGVSYGALQSDSTAAKSGVNILTPLQVGYSFAATTDPSMNQSGSGYVSWTFRNADKFYNHAVVTKSAGGNATVSFANLGTLGMVRVKRTDAAGSWYVWHRSLSAGQLLIGESTAAAATLGQVTVSGTTVTLVNGVIADGTYLVEAFAHDSSADGIIQCGSFTTDGSGNATVNLGWEPQFLLLKKSGGGADNWNVFDTMRGLVTDRTSNANVSLKPNLSNAEASQSNVGLTATGFVAGSLQTSTTYIYLAIRRPNKPPTTGTQVYSPVSFTTAYDGFADVQVGFPVDLIYSVIRTKSPARWDVLSRITGARAFTNFASTGAETSLTSNQCDFDKQSGVVWRGWSAGFSALWHAFRRAPGFMDEVPYTGTGVARTIAHNLASIPELIIVKKRNNIGGWPVYHAAMGAGSFASLHLTDAAAADAGKWNSAAPTASVFSVGVDGWVNTLNDTYVAYLFATLPGISKVGSYTGNGSSQTINCGLTTGVRFVLIKRADNTGDWYIWDTVRGIVAANDPHLSLNTTAAEVTTDDSIDPDASGFIVNQNAATNVNVLGASYIFLAIA